MSTAVAQTRVKRLVSSGLVKPSRTPNERIAELKSKVDGANRDYHEMEAFFSALGDTTRLKMLKVIDDEELCSCEVMASLELTQPTTSHHLGILERAGVLSSRRNGKWVFYRISNPKIRTWFTKSFDLIEDVLD